jgi:murein DD-endopeptidase MepM/ murein hydrolase activator NlpD
MTLSQKVDKLKLKRETLKKLKDTQKETIAALKRDKKRYIERLNKIKREQNSLSATLKKLNIIKKKREQKIIKSDSKIAVNVRKIGSSYQHGKLVKYRGPKTIAPLRTYTISQNFGNFIDPIYHIKVFNDSVVLKAKRKNAKVYNILDGKVIYAQKTPVLDRVVIIKNRDNIHTIYAHLSKIAPTVKVGRYLKKGYVIGRVDRELNFEVTKDGMNINPMRLIK